MKLEINGVVLPYIGGCTVERNFPFFQENGLEDSYSYNFSIPICESTQTFFGDPERINTKFPNQSYNVRLSNMGDVLVEGKCRLNGLDDKNYILNLTDEGHSIVGMLTKLKLSDLDLPSFTFDNYDDYLVWVESKKYSTMATNEFIYPFMECPDFFSNVKGEGEAFDAAMEIWNTNPVLNNRHDTYKGSAAIIPHTCLFPVISASYILKKICDKLDIEQLSVLGVYKVIISSYFRGRTPLEVFNSGAYREENGKIIIDMQDFIPDMTGLEFFNTIMVNVNGFKMNKSGIYTRDYLFRQNGGFDISPFVIEAQQEFIPAKDGWTLNWLGETTISGNGEYKKDLGESIAPYVRYGVKIGGRSETVSASSIDLVLGSNSNYDTVFPLLGGYTNQPITTIAFNYMWGLDGDWKATLDWEIKAKRQLTVKCRSDNDLIRNTGGMQLMYKNRTFFVKSRRFELLEDGPGIISLVLIQK